MLLELCDPLPAEPVCLRCVHDAADSIYRLLVDEELQLDEIAGPPAGILVIERGIALRRSFELTKEIIYQGHGRNRVFEYHLGRVAHKLEALLFAPARFAQLDHPAEVLLGHRDGGRDEGLL